MAVQAGPSSPVEVALHAKVIRTMRESFAHVIPYAVDAPCYGRDLGFVIASEGDLLPRLSVGHVAACDEGLAGSHRWLTPELVIGKLSVPPYVREAIAERSDVYRDAAPPATVGAAGWESDPA